jgi:excisionase family DNA binding protein
MATTQIEPEKRAAFRIPLFAELVGLKRGTIYDMIRKGELRVITIRGRYRVPATELDRLLGQAPVKPDEGGAADERETVV